MYAIVETGGKQYRAEESASLDVERLGTPVGERVELDRVLLVEEDGRVTVGQPLVAGARVVCRVLEHGRGRKLIIFTYKAKKNQRRKKGHRQGYTRLLVEKIESRPTANAGQEVNDGA